MGEVGRECTKPCSRMHVLRSVAFNSLRDRRGSEEDKNTHRHT